MSPGGATEPPVAPELPALSGPSDVALLLARADRTFGAVPLAKAIPSRKAIVWTNVAASTAAGALVDEIAAQRAVDALRRYTEILAAGRIPGVEDLPTQQDREALERCIRFMRPALLVENDRVVPDPESGWPRERLAAIEALLPAIGSIGYKVNPGPWGGAASTGRIGIATCFAVGPRAVVTNIHVLRQIQKDGRTPAETLVRFDVELTGQPRHAAIPVKGELGRHPKRDVVVLELESDCPASAGLPLSERPILAPAQEIVAIGHPLKDGRSPGWAQVMFEGHFGVKRVSPGAVIGSEGDLVFHDASTLGGNSGSPIVDLASGQVIGVHSLGEFALRNEAVASSALASQQALRDRVARWV